MNMILAHQLIERILSLGADEVCLCAGARNSPFVSVLESSKAVQVWHFFEERSAAFFALGRSHQFRRRPVVVITTSGTAAGELLPAVMEAHYAKVPLILITADRPRRYRRTGAPQCAEQVGLFGVYVEKCVDIESVDDLAALPESISGPLHLNVSFEEPLLDGPIPLIESVPSHLPKPSRPVVNAADTADLTRTLQKMRRPLVLLSQMAEVPDFLRDFNWPSLAYAEAVSQLRGSRPGFLQAGENILGSLASQGLFDSVIRVGGVPTVRFWRDLEDRYRDFPVLSLTNQGFSGLSRPSLVLPLSESNWSLTREHLQKCDPSPVEAGLKLDMERHSRLQVLFERFPQSEPGWFRHLSLQMEEGARLFLGNSLPVREWDLAASSSLQTGMVHATRGLNGIDGQISTFLGWCQSRASNWGIFGDLTVLYDLASPWILRQLETPAIHLVVINNGGGKIFSRMFKSEWFLNSHNLNFRSWAEMWNFNYQLNQCDPVPAGFDEKAATPWLFEIQPSESETKEFWQAYDQIQ